jgi:hypothetical protein
MNGLSRKTLGACAVYAIPRDGIQGTTSIKRITKAMDMKNGNRPSCKQVLRWMKEWQAEGSLEFRPVDTGEFHFTTYNQPLIVDLTPKGLAFMADPTKGDLPPDPADRLPGDLPRWDPAARDLPQKASAVLRCVMDLCKTFNMSYCWASLETIRERCRLWYHTDMSSRSVSRQIDFLERQGFIRRQVRPHQDEDNHWWSETALTEVAERCWEWAKREAKSLLSFLHLTDLTTMANQDLLNKKQDKRTKDKSPAARAALFKTRGHGGLLSLRSILAPVGK